jgi:hypothetical protein
MEITPASLMQRAMLSLLILAAIALLVFGWQPAPYITLYLFKKQDLFAAALLLGFWIALRPALPRLAQREFATALPLIASRRVIVWAAGAVLVIGVAGSFLVLQSYPLSMDEFWARADGVIFATGHPMARIPSEWQPFAPALQPIFLRLLPHAGFWASNYLPMNALIQLAGGPFASPLLAAVSTLLVASLAGSLMPERRGAPFVCVLLFACSSQLLITAMSPYAMSAHLAFNLAWLWLFLRRNPAAQAGAIIVGFLATGLHQFAFFPLFALPFVGERFLSGSRKWAVIHAVAIVAGVLVWSDYGAIAARMVGASPNGGVGTGLMLAKAIDRLSGFGFTNFGLMAFNLLRFQLWQNPLAVPLVLGTAWPLLRTSGPMRALLGGIVLTSAFVFVVIPYQGHGWGYRYLHGELGSLCLLATYGWYEIADREKREWRALFGAMLAFSVVVLLPLRAFQVWHQVAPYAAANRALEHVDADIVVVDAPNHAFAQDLVRNSPLLDNRPKRMLGLALDDEQLTRLCKRYRVKFFTDSDAAGYGIPEWGSDAENADLRPLRCKN